MHKQTEIVFSAKMHNHVEGCGLGNNVEGLLETEE